jgi:hypothetical protein
MHEARGSAFMEISYRRGWGKSAIKRLPQRQQKARIADATRAFL